MVYFMFIHYNQKTGAQYSMNFPARRVLCTECGGSGHVLRQGLRGHAFSSEELFEDPDFAQGYFSGDYDVKCEECNGEKYTVEPNEEKMTKRQRFLWQNFLDESHDDRMEAQHYKQLRDAGIEF